MGISVSPSAFHNKPYQPQTPKVHTLEELQNLKKEPTKVAAEGDIYASSATGFKKLTLKELQYEKFAVDTSKHTYTSHSDGSTDDMTQLVAIRDPMGSGEILTFDLSKKTINSLKEKFGDSNNFFERNDGVLRLNGKAENFVAGWMQNIRVDRSYDKADADRNGKIEGDEAQDLTIAFERQRDYDYIGKKLVQVNAGIVGDNYQSLGRSPDAHHLFETDNLYHRNITTSQYTKFENSVEKELDHTLKMDANLDGTVTLTEGLSDEFGSNYTQQIIDDTQEFHEKLLNDFPKLNNEFRLQNYNIGLNGILTEEEEKQIEESFRNDILYTQEQMKIKQIQEQFFLSSMGTIDMLDIKNHKTELPTSHEGQISYASARELNSNNAKIDIYG